MIFVSFYQPLHQIVSPYFNPIIDDCRLVVIQSQKCPVISQMGSRQGKGPQLAFTVFIGQGISHLVLSPLVAEPGQEVNFSPRIAGPIANFSAAPQQFQTDDILQAEGAILLHRSDDTGQAGIDCIIFPGRGKMATLFPTEPSDLIQGKRFAQVGNVIDMKSGV